MTESQRSPEVFFKLAEKKRKGSRTIEVWIRANDAQGRELGHAELLIRPGRGRTTALLSTLATRGTKNKGVATAIIRHAEGVAQGKYDVRFIELAADSEEKIRSRTGEMQSLEAFYRKRGFKPYYKPTTGGKREYRVDGVIAQMGKPLKRRPKTR